MTVPQFFCTITEFFIFSLSTLPRLQEGKARPAKKAGDFAPRFKTDPLSVDDVTTSGKPQENPVSDQRWTVQVDLAKGERAAAWKCGKPC